MKRLVAYDGSPSARRALEHAVAQHRDGDDTGLIHGTARGALPHGHLDEARRLLAFRGIDAVPITAVGNVAHEICVAAERREYDTIVVGRRNIRDSGLVLLGSVAARVVGGAPCSVLVVA